MFSLPVYVEDLRREKRELSVYAQLLERSQKRQKEINADIEEKNKDLQRTKRELEKENKRLRDELEKARLTIDHYKQMLFEKHKHTGITEEGENTEKGDAEKQHTAEETQPDAKQEKKKNGQKKGHTGHGRKKPEHIDTTVMCFLQCCPDCGNQVNRSESFHSHITIDIPHWREMQPVTTEYQIEAQWCSHCQKHVHAVPFRVIPGARIGLTLFLMILIWRYYLQIPFNKISAILLLQYGIALSEGALVGITKKARIFFGNKYDGLLNEIRGAPLKHADETSWGMDGLLYWCWIFLSEKSVYYTIEETRGKGVPEEKLKDAVGVLVRDGYTAYEKLPITQQACFAHPYRKARDAKDRKGASEEVKKLFADIQTMYGLLDEDLQRPFVKSEREELFEAYKKDLEKIAQRVYLAADAKQIQTYLVNLGENLFTALLYKNVPLTNNAAEQAARKIVIGRKISGGSRSKEGAKTHAVNMSIIQTLLKQKLPIFATLEAYTLEAVKEATKKN